MLKTNITEEEKILLRRYAKESPLLLIRLKAQAVLMWSNRLSNAGVADVVGRSQRRVVLWKRAWNNCRMASLFSGHAENYNASKLTREQVQQVKETLSQPPSDYGIPKSMWDVPALKAYLSATFAVVYESPESYYFLLRFSGLSFKYPDTFDRKRDPQAIAERMAVIRLELAPVLAADEWEVFAADEVKMQQEAIIHRAWLKKGQRTVIKVNRDTQAQSYLGFLNQKTYQCHLSELVWQNSTEVLKAAQQFLELYPNKKLCIVWDNASFHKSQVIRDELRQGGRLERVHLIAMPPYAPDRNPIEHVWNTAKQAVANIQHDTFDVTKQAFRDFVTGRLFCYSI